MPTAPMPTTATWSRGSSTGAVIHDADLAAERVLRMVTENEITTVERPPHPACPIDTVCVHGDTPGAVAMARRVRDRLAAAGVTIRPMGEA